MKDTRNYTVVRIGWRWGVRINRPGIGSVTYASRSFWFRRNAEKWIRSL